jgi:hypothetical protein
VVSPLRRLALLRDQPVHDAAALHLLSCWIGLQAD